MWFFYGLCILVAAMVGYDWERQGGMVVSAVLCFLAIQNVKMSRAVSSLESRVRRLMDTGRVREPEPPVITKPESPEPDEEAPFISEEPSSEEENLFELPPLPEMDGEPDLRSGVSDVKPEVDVLEEGWMRFQTHVRHFFTQGNVVVKIAWIILFFGVGFLLKYASDRQMFPVELRYIAASSGALAVLALGWKMREKHRAYALLLQGGAMGVLYMTVFAASKIHGLIPMGLTFFVLVSLVLLSGILAVLQNARMTAAFGAAGGFLAPVLTSTGAGSHVMLFTYYALLNSGILGIAWFKTWRELNLIGFAFTFGIGGLWGFSAYKPELFFSTEPFLILFFVYFASLSVLFAVKQPPRLKGYVDGSLVFGLPVIAFTLQGFLVRNMSMGLAVSALSLSLFYLFLAQALWNRKVEGLRTLTEAFLALGIVFGSLAIPLSLDGRWTAAAWAMEGAALVWVGIRQGRVIARLSGLLLQAGAGISFMNALHAPLGSVPVFNGFYLGCLAVGLSALFSAYELQKHRGTIHRWERSFHGVALIWGLLWWYGAGLGEIDRHVHHPYHLSAIVGFAGLSAWILSGLYGRFSWPSLKYPMFLLVFGLGGLLAIEDVTYRQKHPFQYGGALAWVFSVAVFYRNLYRHEQSLTGFWRLIQHRAGFLLVTALLGYEAAYAMNRLAMGTPVWITMVWGLVPALCALAILTRSEKLSWPFGQNIGDYQAMALVPVMLFLLLWFLGGSLFNAGNPAPLPYLPIINPLELSQLFAILILTAWMRHMNRISPWFSDTVGQTKALVLSAVLVFVWLNTILGRSVHHMVQVSYRWDALWHSMIFQAGLSVLWTLLAMVTTVWAARRGNRAVWFSGAGLLGCVVVKLFCVDLSRSGTIARIVSFLATGALMLIIGFFSPLPPSSKENSE